MLIFVLLLILVVIWFFYEPKPDYEQFFKPSKLIKKPQRFKKGKIFVSIASYRDNECPKTVKNLIETCSDPKLLNIVICQQNGNEIDALELLTPEQKNLVTIERLSHKDARGPCWARWRIQQYYTGEEYQLQIDSHSRFEKNWDKTLIKMLKLCDSEKPVLTQYPSGYNIETNEKEKKLRGPLYIQKISEKDKFTRIQSNWWKKPVPDKPFKSKAWAACFSFSKGQFINENPYDQFTPFLFFGEELDISVRAYTNGWGFYSPNKNVVYTCFSRKHRKTFWENPNQKETEKLSRKRVYERLGYIKKENVSKNLHFIFKYGIHLGNKKTIKDYEQFIGMNLN